MTKKPLKRLEYKEVFYDAKRWNLLNNLRAKAIRVMEALEKFRLEAIVHGSIPFRSHSAR